MVELGEDAPGLRAPVVLVGMMGCGKTAVGTALAQRLGVPFRDTDEAIVAASRMTIPEIFERDGERFFRDRETEVLRRLLAAGPGVVSTGGGVFLRPENRAAIAEAGTAVWLRAELDLLWSRVRHKTTRPLLMTDDPRATLARLLRERGPSYAEAPLVVDADPAYTVADMVSRVIDTLRGADLIAERA
ncbi:shikimate kinase [Jannaschia sp. W003]|uniref:shikimate kinase n=1 Tax=Jannaschia sp. W003 TaxID=2867012 RepID=UPI0021A295F6|nr:shikimate kinase [Jannaschia sp. W003]UWQ20540.1 shikimate kinase [Jannaschia sp. W003]